MWWRKHRVAGHLARLAVVFAAAGLTAGCFEPLYANRPAAGIDNVHDKLAAVEIAPATSRPGAPDARIAVGMHNALQYDLNGGAGATAPTHRLLVAVGATGISFIIDITSGRPTAQIGGVTVNYQLVEIATGKVVLKDTAYSHVDYDIPGSQQRFAQQRAERRSRRTARSRSSPKRSATDWRRISSPALDGCPGHGRGQSCRRRRLCRPPRSGPAGGAGVRSGCGPRQRTRQCHRQGVGRRPERSVRTGAARRRGHCRRSVAAGRGSANHSTVRRPPRGMGEGRKPQHRAGGRRRCSAPAGVECRVVIEAGDLRRNAPLRTLCERAKNAAALPCYADSETRPRALDRRRDARRRTDAWRPTPALC